jgi:hypothetical protein
MAKTTSFHLNEMTCFGLKRHHFGQCLVKKNKARRRVFWHYSLSSFFGPVKADRETFYAEPFNALMPQVRHKCTL